VKWMSRTAAVLLLLAAALIWAGCFQPRERVMIPPEVDLRDIESMAVVYWENYTPDPGLAAEMEKALADELQDYYAVADRLEVDAALQRAGIRRGMAVDREMAQEIGDILDVDAVISGDVDYYFENVSQDAPQRRRVSGDEERARWTVTQETSASVVITGRVFDTASGRIVYSRDVEGRYTIERTDTIAWDALEAPPTSLVRRPTERDIPDARAGAVVDAAERFSGPLLPTYQWRRVENDESDENDD